MMLFHSLYWSLYWLHILEVYFGSLSCWKTNNGPTEHKPDVQTKLLVAECCGSGAGNVCFQFWINQQCHAYNVTSKAVTPPPPCCTVGTTCSDLFPILCLTKTWQLEPKISNLAHQTKVQICTGLLSILCFLVQAILFLLASLRSSFFGETQPRRPDSTEQLKSRDVSATHSLWSIHVT